ncbi:hypothetical protein VTO73DRAFT_5639 [Trametes versicolor]
MSNCRRLIIRMSTCVSLSDTPDIGGILCIVVWTIANGVLECPAMDPSDSRTSPEGSPHSFTACTRLPAFPSLRSGVLSADPLGPGPERPRSQDKEDLPLPCCEDHNHSVG